MEKYTGLAHDVGQEESMAKVYSYLRFSDPKQAAGSSADRQLEYAARWAEARGWVLDKSLSLRDEGLSAFHQRHIKTGALGVFLRAIEDGRVPAGSVLIVEGLDRLSRAEPLVAQAQLTQIIHAGITVVTAADGQEYSLESIRENPYRLIHSLVVMIRAHEESDTKSKRVRAAIRRRCEAWQAGTWRGIIRNGKDPHWVDWDGEAWQVVPDRIEALRWAVDRYRSGASLRGIADEMQTHGRHWTRDRLTNATHIRHTLKNPVLMGDRVLRVDGLEYRLAGYYPAVLSPAEFADLQLLMDRRSRPGERGPGVLPNLLTGMRIAECGHCGGALVSQTLMGRRKDAQGRVQPGHRRLNCADKMRGLPCACGPSIQAGAVETALLMYCMDAANLAALSGGGDMRAPILADLAATKTRLEAAETKLARLVAVLAGDDGATPITLLRTMRELESEAAREREAQARLEAELAAFRPSSTDGTAERWRGLIEGVLTQDVAALMAAREMVRATFSRVVVWFSGTLPEDRDDGVVEIELTARRGGRVRLRVDRLTGTLLPATRHSLRPQ
jgi:DNA invertase Pin-like site-specific DNA recombinase